MGRAYLMPNWRRIPHIHTFTTNFHICFSNALMIFEKGGENQQIVFLKNRTHTQIHTPQRQQQQGGVGLKTHTERSNRESKTKGGRKQKEKEKKGKNKTAKMKERGSPQVAYLHSATKKK